jgi:FkbM family methyltransferase
MLGLARACGVARYVWNHPANEGCRLSALGRAASAQAKGKLFGRPTIAHIGSSRFLAEPGMQSFAAVYGNPYDYHSMMVWRHLLNPGDLFVDVGASAGAYTLWAREQGAHVIAIEPDAQSLASLRRNLDLNDASDVQTLLCALTDKTGLIRFTVGKDAIGHVTTEDGPTSQEVEARTLDEVLGDRHAAGVKIDVEGAEELVLSGSRRALAERRIGMIQLEWNDRVTINMGSDRTGLLSLLRQFDYGTYRPDRTGRLHPDPNPETGEMDVFARPGQD